MAKWRDKDERQYEHIKQSSEDRGIAQKRAKQIAARTVNKQRREEGRTPRKQTHGTGNPNLPLDQRSKDELLNRARQLQISGRSTMNKSQLIQAIRERSG